MENFCSHCGSELANYTNFCPNCGKQINNIENNAKSKIIAVILALVFGVLGVHNFYLGYFGKAIAQLMLTVLSCGLFSVISGIWAFIEALMILSGSITTDGLGVRLKD